MPSSIVPGSLFDVSPQSNNHFSPKTVLQVQLIQFDRLAWENTLPPALPTQLLLLYPCAGMSVLVPAGSPAPCHPRKPGVWWSHSRQSPRTGCRFLMRPHEKEKLTLSISLEKLYRLKYSNISHKIPLLRHHSTLKNGLCS